MNCRVCHGESFGHMLDLGALPLVNNLLHDRDEPSPTWPLRVVFCRGCSLAQLTETPPPDLMFRDYCYFSSLSETMNDHARRLAERYVEPGQRVLEVASNDGYLLRHALDRGATVLGVDPARNVAAHAVAHGVPTRCDYFDRATALQIRDEFGPADVLFANNVLAHVPDPHEIAAGIAIALADDGVAHVEMPSLVRLVEGCAFDTIYHEHHCYFTVTALRELFRRHDLRLVGVEEIPVHGGSLHLGIARRGDETQAETMIAREREIGIFDDAYYLGFAHRVETLQRQVRDTVASVSTVAAYGAAAKGVVMLNALGLDAERLPWVADVSPQKQGRFIPGTRQPVVHPSRLVAEMPEACLILPWNIATEIKRHNAEYAERGGRFLVPRPAAGVPALP